MKTTVDISEPLLRTTREFVSREGITLGEVGERGLHGVLSETKTAAPFKLRRASVKGERLQPELRHAS